MRIATINAPCVPGDKQYCFNRNAPNENLAAFLDDVEHKLVAAQNDYAGKLFPACKQFKYLLSA